MDAGIRVGDEVALAAMEGKVVLRRRAVSDRIGAETAAGRIERFESDEAFIAALEHDLRPLASRLLASYERTAPSLQFAAPARNQRHALAFVARLNAGHLPGSLRARG